MYILDTMLRYIFWIPLIVLPWLIYSWFSFLIKTAKRKEKITASTKILGAPFLLFGIPILLGIILIGIVQVNERERVLDWLHNAGTDVTVAINGTLAPNPQQIVNELKLIHPIPTNHSHPTTTYQVQLQAKASSLTLYVAQDSSDPEEFWVFSPRYRTTSNNEIGKIQISIFKKGSVSP